MLPMSHSPTSPHLSVKLSLVIPVYNAMNSIGPLVDRIVGIFQKKSESFEVVLVNDGSQDESRRVCLDLVKKYPDLVTYAQLSRNFGEHNAVLAGLNLAKGEYTAVLDDDGQNPHEEVVRMLDELERSQRDVIYGYYMEKKHSYFRNLGSRLNDWMATRLLQKPEELYLASFKVMNRFVVDEIVKYGGAFPYIDGLIFRTTRNIGQISVEHKESILKDSRYNFKKLVSLWLNMFMGYSTLPLRFSAFVGMWAAVFSVLLMVAIVVDKVFITRVITLGIPTTLVTITFFAGLQLMILGLIGEYLGRVFMDLSRTPQFVIREIAGKNAAAPR
jgi:glycosyltransferase involved in cell wall biosynthesis